MFTLLLLYVYRESIIHALYMYIRHKKKFVTTLVPIATCLLIITIACLPSNLVAEVHVVDFVTALPQYVSRDLTKTAIACC